MSQWVGVNGWDAEVIRLDNRQLIRVRHRGYLVSYCSTVAEVARLVDRADLVEVIAFPSTRRSSRT